MMGQTNLFMLLVAFGVTPATAKDVIVTKSEHEITIANEFMARSFDISGGRLRTAHIENRRSGHSVEPSSCEEFVIHLKDGSKQSASNFALKTWEVTDGSGGMKTLIFGLTRASEGWDVRLHVEMKPGDWFLRKCLEIKRRDAVTSEVDRIDLESVELSGALRDFPPIDFRDDEKYTKVYAKWNPGLGQPVYAGDLFFGVEFPASDNKVRIRIEAADMLLINYEVEPFKYVSGDYVIKTGSTGTATHKFSSRDGTYDVVVGYVDENNGNALMKVSINGNDLDSWVWDESLGDPSQNAFTLMRRTVAKSLLLNADDIIELQGTRDG